MSFLKILHQICFTIIILCFSFSCTLKDENSNKKSIKLIDSIFNQKQENLPIKNSFEIQNEVTSVLIIPCSNGYDYGMKGFDLNPLIEKRLEEKRVKVKPFSFKKMKNTSYHGVFSKKYCSKILKLTDADFLIMTKMKGNLSPSGNRKNSWGYETKILSTKTLEEIKSISAKNLENYVDIDKHIQENIQILVNQLEDLK